MAVSQNNWPVDPTGAKQDEAPLIRNVTVPNGVRAGDVAVVFRWLAREYDRRVERLVPGGCWGWFVKKIEGSSIISNHASGTAVDFNAPDNPMASGSTERSLTQRQIDVCHAIERESGHVLRWGGDFSRDDPMHWEIVGTPNQVRLLAAKIRKDEEDKVATQFNAEDRAILKASAKDAVDDLTALSDFDTGGGQGSNVGNSVWGHGFPLVPGRPRQAGYTNLQVMYALMLEIQQDVRTVIRDVAEIKATLSNQENA
jgi:hypothetical protein